MYYLAAPLYLQESLITPLVFGEAQVEKRKQDIGETVASYPIIVPSYPWAMVQAEKGQHGSKRIMSGSNGQ